MRSEIDRRAAASYLTSVLLVALATGAELLLARYSGGRFFLVFFSLAVAATTWSGGFGPAVAAVILSTLAADYFLIGRGTLGAFEQPIDVLALLMFAAGWVAIAWLAGTARDALRLEASARAAARRDAQHAERTAALAGALSRARSEAAVVEAAVQEPLHALQADAAMFLFVGEDGVATVARAVAYEPGFDSPAAQTVPIDGSPLGEVLARRVPVVVERRERRPDSSSARTDPVPPSYQALVGVPLVIGARVAAIVRLDFREPRTFSALDREFFNAIASNGAQALERTWQYESAQRARMEAEGLRERADQELAQRQKTEQALRSSETRYRALATRTMRLHGLTAALSEAVTVDAVARAVVQQGNIVVGATAGSMMLVEDRVQFTSLYAEAYGRPAKERWRGVAERGLCETEAIQTGQPVFIASWEESQERYWRSASAAADAAYVSSAVLPLLVEATPAGVMRFDFSVPVNFDTEYQALLVSVAQHCSQALDRARLYESAQKARAEAETANRTKDEFLSIVSHELRTPLNAVLGWASMLQKGAVEPALSSRALQSIFDNATRQAKLIDDLLDVSRIVAGRAHLDRQEIDLAKLIDGVVESFIPVAASNKVDLHRANVPAAVVLGDMRRLEQVFFNLLANGLKFTPPSGRIEIDGRIADGSVEVLVRDTGVGIEPEFLPHVFERFRQANSTSTRNHGGLGLGLSIAKQLVEAHGGSIAVDSGGRGEGAIFTVRLPLAEGVPTRRPDHVDHFPSHAHATAAPPRLDGVRVLVVDDEPAAREIMGYALTERGARVTVTASAHEAFEALTGGDFDVLLADIAMPNEDGCSLMRRVRASAEARVAATPAAAVTAHARDEERREVLAAGFQLHLVKPIEPGDLARAVNQLVRGGAVLSS